MWGMVYMQETDSVLTPSRLLLRLREARGAAAGAAAGMRRARTAAAAAEARAAAAEAAESRIGSKLTAVEQRVHAREEQCRRLQAQQAQAELKMVCPKLPRPEKLTDPSNKLLVPYC